MKINLINFFLPSSILCDAHNDELRCYVRELVIFWPGEINKFIIDVKVKSQRLDIVSNSKFQNHGKLYVNKLSTNYGHDHVISVHDHDWLKLISTVDYVYYLKRKQVNTYYYYYYLMLVMN